MHHASHLACLGLAVVLFSLPVSAQLPPRRSTLYDGSAGVRMQYPSAVYAPDLDMTIEAWVFREDATRCETLVSQDFTRSFWFGFCGNSLRFYRNGGKSMDAGVNVGVHRWTHVAVTYNGFSQQARFYVDGALVATKASTATNAPLNLPLYLGSTPAVLPSVATYPFKGALDEVRIWARVLNTSEIAANRLLEITEGSGLVARFAAGGGFDSLNTSNPSATAAATPQIFGVLPRDIVLPRRPLMDPVDGDITGPEYEGSDVVPLRTLDGSVEIDVPVRMNSYLVSGTPQTYVYVGVPGSELPGLILGSTASMSWYFGLNEADRGFPDSSDHQLTTFFANTPDRFRRGDGVGAFITDTSPSGTIKKAFCSGDVNPPCAEMGSLIPVLPAGIPKVTMLDFFFPGKLPANDRRYTFPFDAVPTDPRTWARVTIGSVVGAAETVRFQAKVQDIRGGGLPPVPLGDVSVRLTDLALNELAVANTHSDGTVSLEATVRTGTSFQLELAASNSWPRLGTHAVPGTGVLPATTSGGTARFAVCAGCDFADVVFDTHFVPNPAIGLNVLPPSDGLAKRTVLRETPLKEIPPGTVTITGTNLHWAMEAYLSTCDRILFNDASSTPAGASGCNDNQFLPATILDVGADGRSMTLSLDVPAAPNGANLRVLLRDTANRVSRRQWTFAPGSIRLGEPLYPLVHGFEFFNERDGTQFDEFSGVFQWNAYDCLIPPGFVISPQQTCPGCRIPNPVYLTYYSLMFTPWVEAMPGSCLGMAATSLLLARRELHAEDFQAGVRFAAGFPHRDFDPDPVEDSLSPPKPQEHRFRVCDYSEPVNIWAHIHRNQAIQTTSEFLHSVLGQMYGTGLGTSYSIDGNPGAVLEAIRTSNRSTLLCFQNQGNVFESHCVVPYAVIDGKGLATNGFDVVDRATSSLILVYDSNWPERTDRAMEVDRTTNRYRYLFGRRREPDGAGGTRIVDVNWGGSGIYAVPLSIWRGGRSMPGFDLLERGLSLVLFGSADAMYSDADSGRWGWEKSGEFRDTYAGAKAMAPITSTGGEFAQANTSRSIMFFPPTNRPPAAVQVNVRGGAWTFHAAEAGTVCQLEVLGGVSGDTDSVKFGLRDGVMNGFRFAPQRRTTTFTPRLGLNLGTNPAVVFIWENLAVGAGRAMEFAARHAVQGVDLINDSGEAAQPTLRVLRATLDGLKTNAFGPFTVPAGASHRVSLPSLDPSILRSELDLNRDGVPESVAILNASKSGTEPPPNPEIAPDAGLARIRWRITSAPWSLESTSNLATEPWKPAGASPTPEGGYAVVRIPASSAAAYFRLRRQN